MKMKRLFACLAALVLLMAAVLKLFSRRRTPAW